MSRQEAAEIRWKELAEENRAKRIRTFAELVSDGAFRHHLCRSKTEQPLTRNDLACIVAAAVQLWVETQS